MPSHGVGLSGGISRCATDRLGPGNKVAMASACPAAAVWGLAACRLNAAARARGSPVAAHVTQFEQRADQSSRGVLVLARRRQDKLLAVPGDGVPQRKDLTLPGELLRAKLRRGVDHFAHGDAFGIFLMVGTATMLPWPRAPRSPPRNTRMSS
jgi:hypothetical protein